MNKNIIIVTGKSGSGKSFIALKIASRLNATYLNLDDISHEVLSDFDVANMVKEKFGNVIFDGQQINTKKLGEIVFADAKKLDFLNKLVQSKMETIIDEILEKNADNLIILDYALLPKMKYFDSCACKILVTADDLIRKSRILKRDKISNEYFSAREQHAYEYDKNEYDIVLDNSTNVDFEKLIFKIKEVLCLEKQ